MNPIHTDAIAQLRQMELRREAEDARRVAGARRARRQSPPGGRPHPTGWPLLQRPLSWSRA